MDVVYTLWLRSIKRYMRSKSRIIGSLGMPLFFLFILGFGLNSSLTPSQGMGTSYVGFVIPGVIAMSVLFTSIFSGIQIIWDKQFGFLKETLVAPASRFEIMLGQTVGGATTGVIQGIIILLISLLIGKTSASLLGFLIVLGFMLLIGVTFTALGVAIASRLEDMQGFQLIMNFVVFPIFGLSGALFPLAGLPPWLHILTSLDPLTYGVEGIRYGLLGTSQINPVTSFIVLSVVSLVTILIGAWMFKRIKF